MSLAVTAPLNRDQTHLLIARQIEGGCRSWWINQKSDAVIVRYHYVMLGEQPRTPGRTNASWARVYTVSGVLSELERCALRAKAEGHRVIFKPVHTDTDQNHRVALCTQCHERAGEARVSNAWVCGVCVPLDNAIGRLLAEQG